MAALVERILRHLHRADVTEVAVVSGRLPCIKVGGQYQPVDPLKLTPDGVLDLLRECGGTVHVTALGSTSTHWTHKIEGLGVLGIVAVRREGNVQARIAVARRDSNPKTPAVRVPDSSSMATAPQVIPDSSSTMAAARRWAPDSSGARSVPESSGAMATAPRFELDSERGMATHSAATPALEGHAPAGPARAPMASFGGDLSSALDVDLSRGAAAAAPPPAPPDKLVALDSDGPSLELEGVGHIVPRSRMGMGGGADFVPAAVGVRPGDAVKQGPPEPRFDGTVDSLLRGARDLGASDLHIIAGRPPLYRIGGDLVAKGDPIAADKVEAIVRPLVPSRVSETFEKEGSIDFALERGNLGRFRANVVRQRTGLAACLRLIPFEVPTLESLGLPEGVAAATRHHQGLIVLTGPTGHGKTTTLTALVNLIDSETTHHVITVEDPVEFVHPRKKAMMSQREVGTHTRSFRSALKGSLREDPDVIVIGELRDTETVRIALAASETGHLVIGTMNTPNAAKTIDRLIDLFPPADQAQVRMTLAGGLKLVMSQRLVPTADRTGMNAAVEILPGSVALWNLIRDSKTFQIPSLQQRGKALGITRLDDSLADLVRAGKTTLENALPFAESPDELKAKIVERSAVPLPVVDAKKDAGKGILGKAGALFGKKGG